MNNYFASTTEVSCIGRFIVFGQKKVEQSSHYIQPWNAGTIQIFALLKNPLKALTAIIEQ
jgi:hypothetical protein